MVWSYKAAVISLPSKIYQTQFWIEAKLILRNSRADEYKKRDPETSAADCQRVKHALFQLHRFCFGSSRAMNSTKFGREFE